MSDKKVTQLTEAMDAASEDLVMVVDDPSGTPANKKITIKNLFGKVNANTLINGTFEANTTSIRVSQNSTPANSTATGLHGTIKWDENSLYLCVANNQWKKIDLSSF